ncbi:hypothetical protein AB1N83_013144 [Pleurotus pulmonarius]
MQELLVPQDFLLSGEVRRPPRSSQRLSRCSGEGTSSPDLRPGSLGAHFRTQPKRDSTRVVYRFDAMMS